MNDGLGPLPWDDCKVAFGISCDDEELWNALFPQETARRKLPPGWSLKETDATGARMVAVFRVKGELRREDGEKVAAIIREIEQASQLSRLRRRSP